MQAMTPRQAGSWFDQQAYVSTAPLRLVCVPYAGGSGALFQNWPAWLQGVAEVCPAHLPGRGTRRSEPAYTSVDVAVDALADAIVPIADRPFALFGCSMGALIAYELARRLDARHRPPAALIVAACAAPHLFVHRRPRWHLPTPEFLRELQALNGTPPELLADPELMALFLPVLRADFQLFDTYGYVPGPPLTCPITACAGAEDTHAPREHMDGWAQHTIARCAVESFPGDHFFIRSAESRLLRVIERALMRVR